MNILVIGSGGREHALVWKIAQSKKVKKIFCAPGNPGTGQIAGNISIEVGHISQLAEFAKSRKIDLTIIGPEAPLISGIVDLFEKNNLKIIGPSKKASQIEGSKVFAKKLMEKYGIPSAEFEVFDDYNKAINYAKKLKYPQVVKADGQCFGKGVAVCDNYAQAEIFLKQLLNDKIFGIAGEKVTIEECLQGQEISYMVATDGDDFVSFLPSQDHKRVYDNDLGPNTGGMGAYAPVPLIDKKLNKVIEDTIVRPTLKAMKKEGYLYKGILYPGLILTLEGPKVLEYNCRFGDPETQQLMMLLKTDIIDIFEAIINKSIKNLKVEWNKGSAVCVVLTAKGYPGRYEKGKVISGLVNDKNNIQVFHAGTKRDSGKIKTSGGRVLGVTATGRNLKVAIDNTYKHIGKKGIHFSGMHYRKDIGMKGLKENINNAITYSQVGDNYDTKDPILRLSQQAALETASQLIFSGFAEVVSTRGSSAFVWEQGNVYMATVLECLGTKNLIADALRKVTGKTYYDIIAYDTVATFINDLITVGAKPLVSNAYWAVEDNVWLQDKKRMDDFILGWKDACIEAKCAWGGGETPTLKGIIKPDTADLAGSVVGIIKPKKRLVTDDKLRQGDRIILLRSSGPNANGISLARKIAEKLPKGYATKLPNGKMFGEEILQKSHIYSRLIQNLLDEINVHYIVNITGHGFRKIMRARQQFTYQIERIYPPHEVFLFIQKHAGLSDYEMYKTYNMGMDYALYVHNKDVPVALKIIKKHKYQGIDAGEVTKGERKVVIQPKNITYDSSTYQIR